jgi:hypothetical protein
MRSLGGHHRKFARRQCSRPSRSRWAPARHAFHGRGTQRRHSGHCHLAEHRQQQQKQQAEAEESRASWRSGERGAARGKSLILRSTRYPSLVCENFRLIYAAHDRAVSPGAVVPSDSLAILGGTPLTNWTVPRVEGHDGYSFFIFFHALSTTFPSSHQSGRTLKRPRAGQPAEDRQELTRAK